MKYFKYADRIVKIALYSFFYISIFTSFLSAETIEEALDRELLNDAASPETVEPQIPGAESRWKIFGFFESLNDFYVPNEGYGRASNYRVIKLENHGNLNLKYTVGSFYGKAIMDVFYYPAAGLYDWQPPREQASLEAKELYVKGGEKLQFRLGKQFFSWGAADMFQITNYFDCQDQREFFAAGKDSRYQGIPALSLKYLIGNYSIEFAGTPVHNPSLMPEEGGFWYYSPGDSSGALPVVLAEGEKKQASIDNGAFAVRAGGNVFDVDFHVSYYNGMNTTLAYKPELAVDSSANIIIEIKPYCDRVQMFGLDFAFTLSKFSFRGEALFSHDMVAVSEIDPAAAQTGIMEIMGFGYTDEEISPVESVPYFAYTAGADYNFRGVNGLVLVEWMQGLYLKDRDEYVEPVINKMLLVRVQDKFINESLEVEAGTIMRPVSKDFGYAIMGEAGWNFKNGLTVSAGAIVFTGKDDELLKHFDDKDMCYFKAKMEF